MKHYARRYFPGGNTVNGFHSFFQHIINPFHANRIFILKGGPGTGKSSLMKKLGEFYYQEGFNIEYFHCSSDPDSLDGIVINALGVAVIDGTAPHMIDPDFPGAIEEIINLGDTWDENKLIGHKENIIEAILYNKYLFQKAYAYLKAIRKINEVYDKDVQNMMKDIDIKSITEKLIAEIFADKKSQQGSGEERTFFAFGITPKGIINYRAEMISTLNRKIVLKESDYTDSSSIMHLLQREAKLRGFNIISLRSPLQIDKVLDLVIDELGVLVSVDHKYHQYEFEYDYFVDLNDYMNINDQENKIDINKEINTIDILLNQAIDYLKQAKENHDHIESYYVAAMDFSQQDVVIKRLIEKINQFLPK